MTRLMLTDSLPDRIGRSTISEVEVWENERLDPVIALTKVIPGTAVSPGSWSQRFLRAGERMPWVKIRDEGSIWGRDGAVGPDGQIASSGDGAADSKGKREQELRDGWKWVPGEEWRVDVSGLWSDVGVDTGKF